MPECLFVFWDVQHGNASYIKTPGGKDIVVDLGSGSYGNGDKFSPIKHIRENYNVGQLDGLIITHPHIDHISDIININHLQPVLLERPMHIDTTTLYENIRQEDVPIIDAYLKLHREYQSPVPGYINALLPQNNGGVTIRTFSPSCSSSSNINNCSIVTIASYAGSKILIPGDNEPASWEALLQQPEFMSEIKGTNILVAPHHGRDSGFSSSLFEYINPYLTIISDGQFCDTSATDRYAKKMQGWTVYKRSGGSETRKCVTTRNDGVIMVKIGSELNGKRYINVTID